MLPHPPATLIHYAIKIVSWADSEINSDEKMFSELFCSLSLLKVCFSLSASENLGKATGADSTLAGVDGKENPGGNPAGPTMRTEICCHQPSCGMEGGPWHRFPHCSAGGLGVGLEFMLYRI